MVHTNAGAYEGGIEGIEGLAGDGPRWPVIGKGASRSPRLLIGYANGCSRQVGLRCQAHRPIRIPHSVSCVIVNVFSEVRLHRHLALRPIGMGIFEPLV